MPRWRKPPSKFTADLLECLFEKEGRTDYCSLRDLPKWKKLCRIIGACVEGYLAAEAKNKIKQVAALLHYAKYAKPTWKTIWLKR